MSAVVRLDPDTASWPEVLALLRTAFAFMDGQIDPPSSLHRLTIAEMARQAAPGAVFAVIENGHPVACLFCSAGPDALYLGKLAVAPSRRGRGLARALIHAAAKEARDRGLTALELSTRVELTENHAAFARLGFVRTGTESHPGYDRPTSILMRKTL